MNTNNILFKDLQEKIQMQIENQKKSFLEEQHKAKSIFESLQKESVLQFEQLKSQLQQQINDMNNLNKNLYSIFQQQPFDFKNFYQSISDYQSQQLANLATTTQEQSKKFYEINNKIVSFYQNLDNQSNAVIPDNIIKDNTKDEKESIVNEKKQVKKTPSKNTVNKNPAKKPVVSKKTTK